jgi:hypothetical protein
MTIYCINKKFNPWKHSNLLSLLAMNGLSKKPPPSRGRS